MIGALKFYQLLPQWQLHTVYLFNFVLSFKKMGTAEGIRCLTLEDKLGTTVDQIHVLLILHSYSSLSSILL